LADSPQAGPKPAAGKSAILNPCRAFFSPTPTENNPMGKSLGDWSTPLFALFEKIF
jgi:hypothetical protein